MSLSIEITGKIHHVAETVFIGEKFSKREFVLHVEDEKNPKYDDYIMLQMTMDNCDKLNSVNFGDKVKVQTNLRGREYERRDGSGKGYFNSLDAWKIEVVEVSKPQEEKTYYTPPVYEQEKAPTTAENQDLPF